MTPDQMLAFAILTGMTALLVPFDAMKGAWAYRNAGPTGEPHPAPPR